MTRKVLLLLAFLSFLSCSSELEKTITADDILGNPQYPAIAYGGYRNVDRSQAPSVDDIREDLKILHAAGFRVLRTYHARLYEHTPRLLEAIRSLKAERPDFEMYIMLGAWMQCENAFSSNPNHSLGDTANNRAEIEQAVRLAQQYPEIVKVIAVGNEAMVHWAASYYVEPGVILHWVNYLQDLKTEGSLSKDLWISSSDNFASWGGGDDSYYKEDLEDLIAAVDYLSLHSYPFHDTHYDPNFWYTPEHLEHLSTKEQVKTAINRCVLRVQEQVNAVKEYLGSIGIEKEIHIGETGWASYTNAMYGAEGSKAADEYKQMLFYQKIHEWAQSENMSCFYFEAFDEPWKDDQNPGGSENHFGLFGVKGEVKMPMWETFDKGLLEGLKRNGQALYKSFGGNEDSLLKEVLAPPLKSEMPVKEIRYPSNSDSTASKLVILDSRSLEDMHKRYPTGPLQLSAWEGSCTIELKNDSLLYVETGNGAWWGAVISYASGESQNLEILKGGHLHFSLRTSSKSSFEIGLQSGFYDKGTQALAGFKFGPNAEKKTKTEWQTFDLDLSLIKENLNWKELSGFLYFKGLENFDGQALEIKDIYFSLPD